MNQKSIIEEKVFAFIRTHGMLSPGDRVMAGVSGGADSVCLLFVLLEWSRQAPLDIAVAHVNHGIRPDAGEDARFVEKLCRELGLPFYLEEIDVAERARRERISQEEAGRLARYEAFRRASESFGAVKTAVAHNAGDSAETMLFNLFRGTGLSGLCGIRPVRDRIIRPLLCLEREEIEAYLEERGIPFRTDSTNCGDDYARNRIRHHILPWAGKEISGRAVLHMSRTAAMLRETEAYLEEQTQAAGERCVERVRESFKIDAAAFRHLHPVIGKRLLHSLLKELSPGHRDIARIHVEQAEELLRREGNRGICLPGGIRCRREYGGVFLEPGEAPHENSPHEKLPRGANPPGDLPPEALPPGDLPRGAIPPGDFPPEDLPPGGFPRGANPPGDLPPEALPPGDLPHGAIPPGDLPREDLPPGGFPPEALPPGDLPHGAIPPGDLPPEALPPGGFPRGAIPPGDLPPEDFSPGAEDLTQESRPEEIRTEYTIDTRSLPPEGRQIVLEGLGEFIFTVFTREKGQNIPQNRYTKWFDYDKIIKPLKLRSRRKGDYLTIRGRQGGRLNHKTVKDYMIGEKIPARERNRIPLLVEEDHCLWVTGYRISEYYKISGNTKQILQVQLRGDCQGSGMEEIWRNTSELC